MIAPRTAVLVATLFVAAAGAAWYHGYITGKLPQTMPLAAAPPQEQSIPQEAVAPPFRVSATLLAPDRRVAHVQKIDADRKPLGPILNLREGETVEGYRLARIDNHRVYFERDGQYFRIEVGADRLVREEPPHAPAAPPRSVQREMKFIPPPANIEEIRRDAAVFIEQMKEHPDFKRAMEERRIKREQQTAPAR